jgi:hypothetical protein
MITFEPVPDRISKPLSPGRVSVSASGQYLDHQQQGHARMEITVQNLFGVACNDEGRTATISFSGSVADMQVGSSSFDPLTGLLVVESLPLRPNGAMLEWPRDQPPHLTMNIEERRELDAKTDLQKANRDSEIVSREAVKEACQFSQLGSVRSATASLFWSDTTIPDIVEMSLRFGDFEGVSYLVFFGHKDDLGICVMDLPVRQNTGNFCEDLSADAKIRVKINVIIPASETDSKPPPVMACSSSESGDTVRNILFSQTYLEHHIGPLMDVIRNNAENAEKSRYFQTHNVNVEIPSGYDHETPANIKSPSVSFCSLGIWDQLRHSVAACSGASDGTDYHDDSSCQSITVGTTIATRESWDL